jgi:NAD(P)-dependent dehydrogenase (short-subunit alcohol dehydrogenase family)
VLTASLSGVSPLPPDPLYAGTKHFVIGLMRSTALQLAGTGVRIGALCPGATDTPIIPDEFRGLVPLLDVAVVAAAAVDLLETGESGTALTVPFGREPAPWTFTDVPAELRPGAR